METGSVAHISLKYEDTVKIEAESWMVYDMTELTEVETLDSCGVSKPSSDEGDHDDDIRSEKRQRIDV